MCLRACYRAAVSCLALSCLPAGGQVVISEFMASNHSTTADEDGDYEDWIELRNEGAVAVDLEGYGLSDDPADPFKWTFPSWQLAPGGHLVVWASGKDRKGLVPETGLLREVYFDVIGGSVEALEANGNYPSHPDLTNVITTVFQAPTNLADRYGQRISGFLSPPVSGSYEFWISCDNGGHLYLSPDTDPAKAEVIASVPADQWSDPLQWNRFSTQRSAPVQLEAGKRYYMAAVVQEDVGGDHLAVRWRRDGSFGTTELVPAARFILKPSTLHTNFSISADGEPLVLTAPGGGMADEFPAIALPRDISYGRPAGEPAGTAYFDAPTPGGENSAAGYGEILSATPEFSVAGGFHENPFSLTLGGAPAGHAILYTTDGSEPLPGGPGTREYTYKNRYPEWPGDPVGSPLTGSMTTMEYAAPIAIVDRSGEANRLANRSTTYSRDPDWYAPTGPVAKATVVRARVVKEGALPGPVVTHSYFVGPGADERYSLPVISLSMDEDTLFGYEKGNYAAGVDFDNWRSQSGAGPNGGTPANYKRRGAATEFPAHFEMFQPQQGRVVSQRLGFRMHGGWSRAWPQKSIRLYANDDYDPAGDLDYPLIPGREGLATGQPVDSFHRFVLRNSGNDHERTRFRDAFIQELTRPLDLDRQGYQPVVHFINGEYWGLINIRERMDRFYFSSHHGVDPDDVTILANNAAISEGTIADRQDFLDLRSYIAANSMADPTHYAHVTERMDVDNFIRYNVAQIYAHNTDWPHNNIDFWRVRRGDGPSDIRGAADGRWRWALFDTDFGFNLHGGPDSNTLVHATRLAGSQDWSTVKLRRLLFNETFRHAFINTFADQMATSFKPSRVNALADQMRDEIAAEYGEHGERWRNQGSTSANPLKTFGQERPLYMTQHLLAYFGLAGTGPVTLDTPHPERGGIRIHRVLIDGDTPGLDNPAQPFPWTGTYFRGVPVDVTAVPKPGFRFAGWLEHPQETSATITVNPTSGGRTLTALFEEAGETRLVHYWNFHGVDPLAPTLSLEPGAGFTVTPGPQTEVTTDDGQDFSGENARMDDEAGEHLRVNFPIGATMEIALPTSGHEDPVLSFETRRSGQGAGVQSLSYSLDGTTFVPFESIAITETPVLHRFDFGSIEGSSDNPLFKVRVTFFQGTGGVGGNNRFDNLTLDANAIPGANSPPEVVVDPGWQPLVEGGEPLVIDLAGIFEDPDDDGLSFGATVVAGDFASAELAGSLLTVHPLRRGGTEVVLTADDGTANPVEARLRVLVYPGALPLAGGAFSFASWHPDEPDHSFPEHAIFLQSDIDDPGVTYPLEYAYDVGADTHPDDSTGFPYNNTSRTRINGLGDDGISFVNTGRGRDLGAMLVALDTRDVDEAAIAFTAGTVLVNERAYALRLQYRVGTTGEFSDVLHDGIPISYDTAALAGDAAVFAGIPLPAEAVGQPYVQLLWRYHHVAGTTGPRAELRLDDVSIDLLPPSGFATWQEDQFPDPDDLADLAISGPEADPGKLGVSNLMRYALGIDSAADLAARMPRLEHGESGLRFVFPFDPSKDDLAWLVEASGDLDDWSEVLFDSLGSVGVEPADGWLAIEGLDSRPGAGTSDYFRLRVTLLDDGS